MIFYQGGQLACMFSSQTSSLSYKRYNDSTEIISRSIQDSLSFGNPMTFAADLLNSK